MCSDTSVREKLHSVTVKFDAETTHRAKAVYHAIRVEKEPKTSSVTKSCDIEGQFVIVKLESTQLHSLRASSNGLLDIFGLLSEVVQTFDVKSPSENYDHF